MSVKESGGRISVQRWSALITCLALLVMPAGPAGAAAAPLGNASAVTSTGQLLSVAITSPTDGSRVNVPPGTLTVTGSASVGALVDSGNAMYAIDVSGSTLGPTGQDCNGDGVVSAADDLNGDSYVGSTLDCEVAGVLAVNRSLAGGNSVAGIVVFGDTAVVADVGPADGLQAFTGLTTDADQNGRTDIEDVARSLQAGGVNAFRSATVGTATNYDDALSAIAGAFADKSGQNNVAFFLSDGVPTAFTPNGPLATVAALGVKVHTYSVGSYGAGCGNGSALKKIAVATGGTCTKVADPSTLSAVLRQPVTVTGVTVSLNGGTPVPAVVSGGTWSADLTGLTGGIWNQVVATAIASDGTRAVQQIQVYGNRPPTVDAGGSYTVDEGIALQLNGTVQDPDGDAVTISWAPSVHLTGADTPTPVYEADDNLTESLRLTATDTNGAQSTATATVTVRNVPPKATFVVPALVNQGSQFTLALINPFDPSPVDTAVGFTYSYDCGTGQGFTASPVCNASTIGGQKVRGRIADKDGGYTEYTATVGTVNQPPVITRVTVPTAIPVGAAFTATVYFTDPDVQDTHTVQWDWNDGTSSAGTVNDGPGSGTGTGAHAYLSPGLYPITVTVTDSAGNQAKTTTDYVVVYNPNGGFVTAGGWFNGPGGRANLGLNAKYLKGAPTGQTEFQAPNLNFHSTSYQWLVITGSRAQLKGFGTINGAGNYGFMVTLTDGGRSDGVRMKIWDAATGRVVYDTQPGASDLAPVTTLLGGGSVVVH